MCFRCGPWLKNLYESNLTVRKAAPVPASVLRGLQLEEERGSAFQTCELRYRALLGTTRLLDAPGSRAVKLHAC
jgi:hypothetical protein